MNSVDHDCAAAIRTCKFFSRLDARAVQSLAAIATLKQFARHQYIAQPGQEPPGMFIVIHGQVRVFALAPNGKEHVLHLVGPTQTFLEVAVLGEFATPATCQALEDTTAVLLPAEPLRSLLAEHPRLTQQVLASMALWVRHLLGLVEDLTMRDAVGRLARYLLEVSAQDTFSQESFVVELPSLKKHLASHLNLTSETFSRTLKRLTEAGLVSSETRTNGAAAIRILDRQRLVDACEGAFVTSAHG